MTDHHDMEPASDPTSPKVPPLDLDTDDEGAHAIHSDTDSVPDDHGDHLSSGLASPAGEAAADGLLPRDLPKKTAFYDPVAERQMTQTDAKLFYQNSQLEQHKTEESTPQGSPIISTATAAVKIPESTSSQNTTAAAPSFGFSRPMSNLGTSASSLSLASHSYKFPDIETPGSQNHDLGPGPTPRTATRPSLGGYASQAQSGYSLERPQAPVEIQRDMSLPARAPMPISSGYEDNDPHITSELTGICQNIQKILDIRHKYIRLSLQRDGDNPKDDPSWDIYPPPPEPAWSGPTPATWAQQNVTSNGQADSSQASSQPDGQRIDDTSGAASATQSRRFPRKRKPGQDVGEDFEMDELLPLPGSSEFTFRLDANGVYQVFENAAADKANTPVIGVPTIKDYYMDLETILNSSSDGPSKSFAFRRLQYLEGKFNLYVLLNEYQETADTKKVPHRDFYNVRKVDTHIHHSACMNQKHLLRFIKSKMKKCPDEEVLIRDGKTLTLRQVFESINLTAYDLSIDTLDMHAHTDSFHRFDKFNLKYNPIGESRLRTIFLKTDNHIHGRYLAEITKEVISDLESSKYQMAEWRISIYGKSMDEWDNLAAWVVDNKLFSHNVRWLIQIPRLYDVYKATGLMENFEQIIMHIFLPLFEVTKDPQSHPKLHIFLQRVIGFDSVDDESKVERRLFRKYPIPHEWNSKQTPPYSYWVYYLFANMTSLNFWRRQRGFNTFLLRPHCGEAGDSEHLAVAVLCCHSISHGLLLRKVPLLQYMFYLEQIGIAMSPLSNNALFLAYERNPFHQYFQRGLNVSLSTDDPLQFAFTKEPLIEEYAVAAQIYKLSPVDMCELAKNSVKQSGYEFSIKQQWLGDRFHLPGREGNKMIKTNVPDRREEFRYHTWVEEHRMIQSYTSLLSTQEADLEDSVELNGSAMLPGPASPTSSLKTNIASTTTIFESKPEPAPPRTIQGDHTGPNRNAQPSMSSPYLQSRVPGSPLSTSQRETAWATQGMSEMHLSGHEPRYLPGTMTRASRQDGVRRTSMHESDESHLTRSASKRSLAGGKFSI